MGKIYFAGSVDISGVGITAVLKQIQSDGIEKPVAYFSRKLSKSQRKKIGHLFRTRAWLLEKPYIFGASSQ